MISRDDIEAFEQWLPPKVGEMATVQRSPYIFSQGIVIQVFNDGRVLIEGEAFPLFPVIKLRKNNV